jgi:hypothetical protein
MFRYNKIGDFFYNFINYAFGYNKNILYSEYDKDMINRQRRLFDKGKVM